MSTTNVSFDRFDHICDCLFRSKHSFDQFFLYIYHLLYVSKKKERSQKIPLFLVGVTRLERAASCSQSKRATIAPHPVIPFFSPRHDSILAAARSLLGSDSPPDCHSLPRSRYATCSILLPKQARYHCATPRFYFALAVKKAVWNHTAFQLYHAF